jgi:hypothetical protein
MEPVVNRLEGIYNDQIDFRWLDANSPNGRSAFNYYKLLGHPGYVILYPEGKVLWSGIGEISETVLIQQISAILMTP